MALIATGTIAGGVTFNPIVLGTILGAGLKFEFTTYEKVLTETRSFLGGAVFDEKQFIESSKILDDIIIDMALLPDKFERKDNQTFIA